MINLGARTIVICPLFGHIRKTGNNNYQTLIFSLSSKTFFVMKYRYLFIYFQITLCQFVIQWFYRESSELYYSTDVLFELNLQLYYIRRHICTMYETQWWHKVHQWRQYDTSHNTRTHIWSDKFVYKSFHE